jgi:hypothetical protein
VTAERDRPRADRVLGRESEVEMTAELHPEIAPGPMPPKPKLAISPLTTNVSISSGQTVTVSFELERTLVESTVSLQVGTPPPGLTATLSTTSLAPPDAIQGFSLTVIAAPDVTPVAATIDVTASAGEYSATAFVAINASAVGQLYPNYHVLTVVYAPPGTALGTPGSKSDSQAVYATSSSTGTTMSTSASFKAGIDVTATVGANLGVLNLSDSSDFNASVSVSGSSSLAVTKNAGCTISAYGGQQDGIDHANDFIYLWLNPAIGVELSPSGDVTWELGINTSISESMLIQFVLVSWLQNPSTMPADVAQTLAAYGITAAEYPQILSCDPFTSGVMTIDVNRFLQCTMSFPYEPLTSTDPLQLTTYTLTDSVTSTTTTEVSVEYGVTFTESVGAAAVVTATLKAAESLEITASATETTVQSSTQSAIVTIGNPSSAYDGPTDILVYWDTIFSTFMYAFVSDTEQLSVAGTVVDSANSPVAAVVVTLTVGDTTWSTWTDSAGDYRFYNVTAGSGTVSAGGQSTPVMVSPDAAYRPPTITV